MEHIENLWALWMKCVYDECLLNIVALNQKDYSRKIKLDGGPNSK